MKTTHGNFITGMHSCVTLNENTENKNLHITNKQLEFQDDDESIGIFYMHILQSLPVRYERRMEVKVRN